MSKIATKKLILIFALILFVAMGGVAYFFYTQNLARQFKVTFLNIGQGDSALINFGNGEKMLVDCGPDTSVLFALGRNLPFYDRTIDTLLVTHPDRDHYGGCVDVLKRYNVKNIILNGHKKLDDPYWVAFDEAARAEPGAKIEVINGGEKMQVGSSTLNFYSPDANLYLPIAAADSNNYSIVFKLTAPNKKTFLFTGDMEEPLETALMKKYCGVVDRGQNTDACLALQTDVLKVGHHGSNGATGEDFLKAVAPKIAVISVGKNRFGHPTLRVIRHLERAGATILRTDQLGDIVEQ